MNLAAVALERIRHAFTLPCRSASDNVSIHAPNFLGPAPALNWGYSISLRCSDALIARTGWRVVLQDFDVLAGNARPEDRGCVFYLIEKA